MTTKQKVPVAERALIRRVNRKLAEKDQRLCKSRASHDEGRGPVFDHNLGEFYIIDTQRNFVHSTHVDLGTLAKEVGALSPWETVEN